MDSKRNLSLRQLTDLSLGFFGVQIAYALQSANISRIFATLGADPHDLSYFWILPPLMGMVVQPLVGSLSDKTWTRLGRRIPYLVFGATVAVIVMCLLPNAGSLGLTVAHSMLFGLVMLMLLDTSINMAMQPFKMLVGDMVTERQKTKAYSIQSLLCNAGSLVGYLFPFLLTVFGVEKTAAQGVVPPSVVYSFYTGAAIIVVCVIYTMARVKEMPPKEYREFHNIKVEDEVERDERIDFGSLARLVKGAPRTFWTVGLVQFFCWAAFLYMWTYLTGAVAENGWGGSDTSSADYQDAANWVGVLYAVQAIGAIVWATFIPRFQNIKVAYAVSLLIGAAGFASLYFVHDPYAMVLSLALVGPAWAAMLAIPFTLLTNSLEGTPSMGTYLGLFNCTICLPQIVAAMLGGTIMSLTGCGQPGMMVVAGILLLGGAMTVRCVKVDNVRK